MTKTIQTQNNAFNFNDFNNIPHFYLNKKRNFTVSSKKQVIVNKYKSRNV